MPPYAASYWYDGARHTTKVNASSWEEAERKLKAMALGRIDGELIAEVSVVLPTGILGKIRNWFR